MTSACVRPRCIQGCRNWEVRNAQFLYWFLFDARNWCQVGAWGDVKDNSREPSYLGKCKIDAKCSCWEAQHLQVQEQGLCKPPSLTDWCINILKSSIRDAASSSKITTCESQVKQMLMHSDQKELSTKQASQLDIECTYTMSQISKVRNVSWVW